MSFSSHYNLFKCWQIEEVSECDELGRENISVSDILLLLQH